MYGRKNIFFGSFAVAIHKRYIVLCGCIILFCRFKHKFESLCFIHLQRVPVAVIFAYAICRCRVAILRKFNVGCESFAILLLAIVDFRLGKNFIALCPKDGILLRLFVAHIHIVRLFPVIAFSHSCWHCFVVAVIGVTAAPLYIYRNGIAVAAVVELHNQFAVCWFHSRAPQQGAAVVFGCGCGVAVIGRIELLAPAVSLYACIAAGAARCAQVGDHPFAFLALLEWNKTGKAVGRGGAVYMVFVCNAVHLAQAPYE